MGIRARSDQVLIPHSKRESVSTLLIEGVRRLALKLRCYKMIITFPQPIMRNTILPKFGFEQESFSL